MEEMARNLTDGFDGFLSQTHHLIHDRDPLYTKAFGEILRGSGVEPIRLPARVSSSRARSPSRWPTRLRRRWSSSQKRLEPLPPVPMPRNLGHVCLAPSASGQELSSRSRAQGLSAGLGDCPRSPAHSRPRSGRCEPISGAIALLVGKPNYYSARPTSSIRVDGRCSSVGIA